MQAAARRKRVYRFGPFEFDPETRELRKHGLRVQLVGQPTEVLCFPLENPGDLVKREDLQKRLWPADTFVEFENGLNAAVKRLRDRLGDSAEKAIYIETVPRTGYRFIAPVDHVSSGIDPAVPSSDVHTIEAQKLQAPDSRFASRIGGLTLIAIALLGWTLYWTTWRSRRSPESADAGTLFPIRSIAVLPFTNLSKDSDQEYFADGMTDELITNVSKIPNLRVISRTSVTQYKKTNKGLPQIARELNVDGVIEGAVLRSEDRVRVTIQLLHGPSDTHLWAETYERDLHDVLMLQDELADSVARQLRIVFTANAHHRRNRIVNPKAYELYLRGRHYFDRGEVEKTIENFKEAIQLEPDYAEAYARLAATYAGDQNAMTKAKAAALRAIEIDPSIAPAHAALGFVQLIYEYDWTGAEKEFQLAKSLNPDDELTPFWYGCELTWRGDFDRGLSEMHRAADIAPTSAVIHAFWGMTLYQSRRNQEAIEQFELARQLDDTLPGSYGWLGLTYLTMGKDKQSIEALGKAVQLARARGRLPALLSRLGYAYGRTHQEKQAEQILAELNEISRSQRVSPVEFAIVYIGLGNNDKAFYWLDRGIAERSFEMPLINVDPRFDSIRNDSRFSTLLKSMHFPS